MIKADTAKFWKGFCRKYIKGISPPEGGSSMNVGNVGNSTQPYTPVSNAQQPSTTANAGNNAPRLTNGLTDEQLELRMLRREVLSRIDFGEFQQATMAANRQVANTPEHLAYRAANGRPMQFTTDLSARYESILTELLSTAEQGTTRHSLLEQWLDSVRNGSTFDLRG